MRDPYTLASTAASDALIDLTDASGQTPSCQKASHSSVDQGEIHRACESGARVSEAGGNAARFEVDELNGLNGLQRPDARMTALVLHPIEAESIVHAADMGRSLQLCGKAIGEFMVGDTVTLSIDGKHFGGRVAPDGSFSVPVPGADLLAYADRSVIGVLSATSPAGRQTTLGAMRGYSVATAATGAPSVALQRDVATPGVIGRADDWGRVIARIDLPAGAAEGDRVEVSNGEVIHSILLTAQDLAANHVLTGFAAPPGASIVAITAMLTDGAGKTSPQGSDSARMGGADIGLQPPAANKVTPLAHACDAAPRTARAPGECRPQRGNTPTPSAATNADRQPSGVGSRPALHCTA